MAAFRCGGHSARVQAARVALVLRLPYGSFVADALGIIFSPVSYLTERDTYTAVDEVTAQARLEKDFLKGLPRDEILRMLFVMLYSGVTCLKHGRIQRGA